MADPHSIWADVLGPLDMRWVVLVGAIGFTLAAVGVISIAAYRWVQRDTDDYTEEEEQ